MELPERIFWISAGRTDLPVKFECVKVSEIGEYDGSFMTGTSPIVLPFSALARISLM